MSKNGKAKGPSVDFSEASRKIDSGFAALGQLRVWIPDDKEETFNQAARLIKDGISILMGEPKKDPLGANGRDIVRKAEEKITHAQKAVKEGAARVGKFRRGLNK